MTHSIQKEPPSLGEMAFLGALRGVVPFPVEHILERIKLESQAYPEKTSRQAARDLWASEGIKGLYTGSSVNFVRRVGREMYHWPVMLTMNRAWKGVIPGQYNQNDLASNLATGHTMALFQASVTLPLERLLIEKIRNVSYREFYHRMVAARKLLIYEGFQTTWIRHSITWDLFFLSSYASGEVIKQIDAESSHPHITFLCKSVLTSTMVVGVGYPVEFLRNRVLMEPGILSGGTSKGIRMLFNRYKWKRLYSGAPIVLVHNCIQTFIVQKLIDRMNFS